MTKEEILETLARTAKDKVRGSQGVIVLVVQDAPKGFELTAALVNVTEEGAATCLRVLSERMGTKQSNGLLVLPGGKH